jgi:DNA-binding response OmpR family regulator
VSELKKIVLIDDEKAIQTLAKMALEKLSGFEVVTYDSGKEAIANIVTQNPDLILLDVIMPEMEGPEVLSHLRELKELDNTPVFFVTGKNSEDEKKELLILGADDVISKPFDPMKLASLIKEKYNEFKK